MNLNIKICFCESSLFFAVFWVLFLVIVFLRCWCNLDYDSFTYFLDIYRSFLLWFRSRTIKSLILFPFDSLLLFYFIFNFGIEVIEEIIRILIPYVFVVKCFWIIWISLFLQWFWTIIFISSFLNKSRYDAIGIDISCSTDCLFMERGQTFVLYSEGPWWRFIEILFGLFG